jgi:hypothetical protein
LLALWCPPSLPKLSLSKYISFLKQVEYCVNVLILTTTSSLRRCKFHGYGHELDEITTVDGTLDIFRGAGRYTRPIVMLGWMPIMSGCSKAFW